MNKQRNLTGRALEEYKKKLKLTDIQKEIIVGTLLGDSSMSLRRGKPVYAIKFEQGEKNKKYIDHLYEIFEPYTGTPPKFRFIDKEKTRRAFWFRTYRHDDFLFYWNAFYGSGNKIVPELIHRWLTPRALAYWFMDDGTRHKNCYYLSTQAFERHEVDRLCEVFSRNFQIRASAHKDKNRWRIYIRAESADLFVSIINPYIHPDFSYKIRTRVGSSDSI